MKGKCKEFVRAQSMTKMNDLAFKAQFGTENAIPVGKLDRLLTVYPAVKDGIRLVSELNKKDRTWILLAALNYDKPIKLQRIDPEEETAATEAEGGGADVAAHVPTPLVVDRSRALGVTERCFLYNASLLNDIASCLKCVDVNLIVKSLTTEMVKAPKTHMTRRLARKLLALPKHVRHNFV